MKLRRTTIFVPGTISEDEAREIIKTCGADIVCLDLEDTVVAARKGEARKSLVKLLNEDIWGETIPAIRINAISTGFAEDDIIEVVGGAGDKIESILMSKPESVDEIKWLDNLIEKVAKDNGISTNIGYIVGVESAAVLTYIDDYCTASPNVQGLGFAIGDLSTSLGIQVSSYMMNRDIYPGDLYHFHKSRIILAARTHGLWAMDGPWPVVSDLVTLEEDARWGAVMGFDGKLVLVPSQIKTVHKAYRPSEAEIEYAETMLAELARMETEGSASGVTGEHFIDPVVAGHARATLARAKAPI
jgi:citrate lyase subunit beta/citryl-CoA lyase